MALIIYRQLSRQKIRKKISAIKTNTCVFAQFSLVFPQRRKTETKPDTYSKDRIFVTSFAFCVITYEPIEVQTFSAPQNDRQNLVFVKDIKVVVEKMTRNRRKMIEKTADSLLLSKHSIQFSALFLLLSVWIGQVQSKLDHRLVY